MLCCMENGCRLCVYHVFTRMGYLRRQQRRRGERGVVCGALWNGSRFCLYTQRYVSTAVYTSYLHMNCEAMKSTRIWVADDGGCGWMGGGVENRLLSSLLGFLFLHIRRHGMGSISYNMHFIRWFNWNKCLSGQRYFFALFYAHFVWTTECVLLLPSNILWNSMKYFHWYFFSIL